MNLLCFECGKLFLVEEFEAHLKTHESRNNKKFKNIKSSIPPFKKKENKYHGLNKRTKNSPKNINEKNKYGEVKENNKKKIDDNLGLKQCEFCSNMVEDLTNHLKECKAKKIVEEEKEKYNNDIEKRNKEDEKLANQLGKEKTMDVSKDEQIAKNLQNKINSENNNENEQTNKLKIITKIQK